MKPSYSCSSITPVTFDQSGEYVLRLTASDGELTATDDVAITVYPANLPPQVNAGLDQTISTRYAQLQGQVGDDGRPSGALAVSWSQVTGPGNATFGNQSSAITTVAFDLAGEYVLRLTVSDGALASTDELIILVTGNRPPTADAGPDQILDLTVIPESLSTNYFLPRAELPEQWLYDLAQPGLTGFPRGVSGTITVNRQSLTAEGGDVFAGGLFNCANGVEVRGLGHWDGCAWSSMCDPWLMDVYTWDIDDCGYVLRDLSADVDAVAARGNDLFAGAGFFKDFNGDGAGETTARWTGGQWKCWGYKQVSTGHTFADVWDIEATSNAVYVGGLFSYQPLDFTNFPGVSPVPGYPIAHRIAKWTEAGGWETMGQGIVDTNGVDHGGVAAIKEGPNGEVFIGGTFMLATSNGVARNIAKWNGSSWETMSSGVFGDRVYAFAVGPDGALYVGGDFTNAGGVTASRIAKATWNTNTHAWTWSSLGQGVSNGVNNRVDALVFRGTNLYVGGSFSRAGNKVAWRIAKWDGTSWSHVGPDSLAFSYGGNVRALCSADDGLYVGGSFSIVSGQPAGRIIKWGVRRSPTLALPEPVIIRGSPPAGSEVVLTARPGHPCGIPLTVTWNVDGGAAEFTTNLAAGTTAPDVALPFSYFYEPGYHQVTITVEDGLTPPVAGVTTVIVLTPAMTVLNGIVTDDGLPAGVTNAQWTVVDGPGAVGFGCSTSPVTSASFDEPGAYLLRLTADDTEYTSADEVTILVRAVGTENQPPAISAGWDQTITFGEIANLNGLISDDGLPSGLVTGCWSLVSGPGTVTFANPAEPVTTAMFSDPGTYVLRLTGSDSELTSSDDLTITVNPDLNQPPVVDAGEDQAVMFAEGEPLVSAPLGSTVSDDGLPWGIVNEQWSVVDGPGGALFRYRDGSYSATFNTPGTYVLRLTASDGRLEAFDDVTVTVLAYVPPPVVEIVAPTNTQQVTAPTPVIGTAHSPVLASWVLQQRIVPVAASVSEWTTIAAGAGSISASELGALDPTLALNGTYELRLLASDLAGRG
ncbi:MAG: PKD domain-containing protein, partial [Verrucomicrobia bacterium]|nr:PKD domain-containing protein [Verrucomicrobiota bacterium]